ncbi:hypothetical protein ARMSODRAFT_1005084 [Armillaria solidipes]|uniref:F-box domain-containing protein n=1 Tax=Armillaria solidipes TaxID=1076256 RepID=A0A2H3BMA7_9AGAR|nr:hypothetical protein ARMSODRAFT_1005084 [Armillaria solidipes]
MQNLKQRLRPYCFRIRSHVHVVGGSLEELIPPISYVTSSGPKLARYIKRLSVYLSESKELDDAASASISDPKVRKRRKDVRLFNRLFVDAIPLMVSLQSLSLSSTDASAPADARLMFERFSDLPHLSKLEICSYGSWSIPCAQFRRIQDLDYEGPGSEDFLALLRNNPNLESIRADVWPPCIPELEEGSSIFSIFRSFPPGTYSNVKKLTVSGRLDDILQTYKVPLILPHLRLLQSLHTYFPVPDQLWNGLREEGIHLTALGYCCRSVKLALLSYLGSYTGLRELELQIQRLSEQDNVHLEYLLSNVITPNAAYLTKVHIAPITSGTWCLDHHMLDTLALCCSLKSIYLCADKSRARVQPPNNVIDRMMTSLMDYWPHLSNLRIRAVSRSVGFLAVRSTLNQIHNRVLAARFARPSTDMLGTSIETDFAMYSMKLRSRRKQIYAFKIKELMYYGEKECRRKLRFWRRSDPSDEE